MNITVLTASIPKRVEDLHRACLSVANQIFPAKRHLVGIDIERKGGAATYNQLLATVDTDWFCCLDDDDLLDPNHLQVLAAAAIETGADVIYSWCRTEGRTFTQYNHPYNGETLERGGSPIPITSLTRTDMARKVGGFPITSAYDRDLWMNLYSAGAKFHSVHEVTWTYRLVGGNQSWGEC